MNALLLTPLFFMSYQSTGFLSPEASFKRECRVYENKVMLKYTDSTTELNQEKEITLDPRWATLVASAAQSDFSYLEIGEHFGHLEYYALQNDEQIKLKDYTDSGFGIENNSPAAKELIEIITDLCGY